MRPVRNGPSSASSPGSAHPVSPEQERSRRTTKGHGEPGGSRSHRNGAYPTGLIVDDASHAPKLRIPSDGGTTIAVCPVNYHRQPRMTVLTHPFTPHWQAELELGYTRIGDATRPVL